MGRFELTQPPATPDNPARPIEALLDSVGLETRFTMSVVEMSPGARPGPSKSIAYLWRNGFGAGAPPPAILVLEPR